MANKQIQPGENILLCQRWQWKERGWDSEEDGFSLHISYSSLADFVKSYWDAMPDGPAPDEYGCPEGSPFEVGVDDSTRFEVSLLGSKRYGTEYDCPQVPITGPNTNETLRARYGSLLIDFLTSYDRGDRSETL